MYSLRFLFCEGDKIKAKIVEQILEIFHQGRTCRSYLREHYPDLIDSAIRQFGSLETAILEAGIDYHDFLSGFDLESSPSLNKEFMDFVNKVLAIWNIFLEKQYFIRFNEKNVDPIRVDLDQSRWYIIKILPWSKSIQDLVPRILSHTSKKIILIYLKEVTNRPQIESISFRHVNKYMNGINNQQLEWDLRILKSVLNVVKFEF